MAATLISPTLVTSLGGLTSSTIQPSCRFGKHCKLQQNVLSSLFLKPYGAFNQMTRQYPEEQNLTGTQQLQTQDHACMSEKDGFLVAPNDHLLKISSCLGIHTLDSPLPQLHEHCSLRKAFSIIFKNFINTNHTTQDYMQHWILHNMCHEAAGCSSLQRSLHLVLPPLLCIC